MLTNSISGKGTAKPTTVKICRAKTPKRMQAAARIPGPISIALGTSWASVLSGERGMARNMDPNALTKHEADRALVKAKRAMLIKRSTLNSGFTTATEVKNAMKISNSLANPLSGGRAAIETAPTKKNAEVTGIRWASPPMCSISRVLVADTTEPAVRNSRLLNMAWFNEWNRAPRRLIVAKRGRLLAVKIIDSPIPMKITPIFSILEYASIILTSCSFNA